MKDINITYYRNSYNIESIYYKNSTQSYSMHTHTNHIIIGYLLDGAICIVYNSQKYLYHAGEYFCIMPDIPHEINPINSTAYSMISVCVPVGETFDKSENKINASKKLKQMILNAPENVFFIRDMAKNIGISPYHMIRQFKAVCGLTPHQFQIQCRVRKAQKLLETGKSVTEAAYAAGFCDQSHFDRCFHKIVKLTPSAYKQSIHYLHVLP